MKSKILEECLRIARKKLPRHPEYECYKHFSFLVMDDKILSCHTNSASRPFGGYPPHSKLHSEAALLLNGRHGNGFEVVNVRMNKKGDTLLAKPCKCCEAHLKTWGCAEVWWTTEKEWIRRKYGRG